MACTGICPECLKEKLLSHKDPTVLNKGRRICKACYKRLHKAANIGICPRCDKERPLIAMDAKAPQRVKLTRRICRPCQVKDSQETKIGVCPRCNKDRPLICKDPKDLTGQVRICQRCWFADY